MTPSRGGFRLTERRRSRTYRAVGYTTAPVLKTSWATGPMPLPGFDRTAEAELISAEPGFAGRERPRLEDTSSAERRGLTGEPWVHRCWAHGVEPTEPWATRPHRF